MTQKEFMKEFNISQETFSKAKISWDELVEIYNDFEGKRDILETIAKSATEMLVQEEKVHSVRWRVKDSLHLMEKIVRKRSKDPKRKITLQNYETEITDLIGVRVLHLFKSDWEQIHDFIMETWDLHEEPTANVREGDTPEYMKLFADKKCKINKHEFGYRSVHYLIKTSPTKQKHVVEVQVRTIFEEGWSEIDHKIRYPYNTNNAVLSQFLTIFNRLAGSADEMGSFIKYLQYEIATFQQTITEREREVSEMKKQIEKLKIDAKDKAELEKRLENLTRQNKAFEISGYNYGNIEQYKSSLFSQPISFGSNSSITDILNANNLPSIDNSILDSILKK